MNPLQPHEIHVGTIRSAVPLEGARKPAYRLEIDFGPLGVRTSSAQITVHYTPETLVGTQILAVLSFPPKRIAGFVSECLVLGLDHPTGGVILVRPDQPVANGTPVY